MVNKQEILERVVSNLYIQNEYAIDEYGACKYRLPTLSGNVLKCALGGLIPDDLYSKDLEGDNVFAISNNILQAAKLVSSESVTEDISFIYSIQSLLHDTLAGSTIGLRSLKYKARVLEFCDTYSLSSAFLNNYEWS